MGEVRCRLIVYFEEPFWVGVFERTQDGRLSAAKVTFGAEPKDCEVFDYIQEHYYSLPFSPAVEAAVRETTRNPKRMQREAKRQVLATGIGTKSQQALKAQQEESKQARREKGREQRLAQAERMFALKQQKKKEKHRGR